jgi:hypothetical protein
MMKLERAVGYRVRSGIRAIGAGLGVVGFLICAALTFAAQTNRKNGLASIVIVSAPSSPRVAEESVREIDDPATGDRWLLERDSEHPGGPGRMVLVAKGKASPAPAGASVEYSGSRFATGTPAALIHAGEPLIVEEHSRLLDATLEATALGPVREGGTLRVRLSIGGRVVKAVAIAPGRALISPDSGAQP